MRLRPPMAALGAALLLAACGSDSPPPAPMADIPVRAPVPEGTVLLLGLPTAPPAARLAGVAELRRGVPALCAEAMGVSAVPRGDGTFFVLLEEPGFLVTRETLIAQRATLPRAEAPDPALALNLAGVNNGRCDYLIRLR